MRDPKNIYLTLILNYRDFYGRYHNHKEIMIWIAITSFFSASLFLVSELSPIYYIVNLYYKLILLVIILIGGNLYIGWQFKNKEFAADIVSSCTNIYPKIYSYNSFLKKEVNYLGHYWPKSVIDELSNIINERRNSKIKCLKSRLPELLSYIGVSIWTGLIFRQFAERSFHEIRPLLVILLPSLISFIFLIGLLLYRDFKYWKSITRLEL